MYKELAVKISAMFGKMKANEVHMELQYLMDEFCELNPVVGSYNGEGLTFIAEDDETVERIMSIVNQIGEPFSLFFELDDDLEDDEGNLHKLIFIDNSIFSNNVDFHNTLEEFFKSTMGVWIQGCS